MAGSDLGPLDFGYSCMTDVDQVRAAADIVKIVGDYVKLRKAGANYMGLCPFHQEKTSLFRGTSHQADLPLFWLRGWRRRLQVCDVDG